MKRIKLLLSMFVMLCTLYIGGIQAEAYTEDTLIVIADQSAPTGCTLVGIEGDFVAQPEEALKRINEIRYEACAEGVWDPNNSARRLTVNDYVPIKWSYDLEVIARVRAAEASLVTSHTRPNGSLCFTAASPNGVQSWGEVLAYNYSTSMLPGIEQWYEEKSDWVNHGNGVTGHYTQMIDPTNTYIGLGCFLSPNGVYYNCTSGEFSSYSNLSSEYLDDWSHTMVITSIQANAVSSNSVLIKNGEALQQSYHLDIGDQLQYSLGMKSSLEGCSAYVTDLTDFTQQGEITWTSSNEKIAVVDEYGTVTITGTGEVTITATSNHGRSASVTLTPSHSWNSGKVTTKATCSKTGVKTYTCSVCGNTKTEKIAKTAHNYTTKVTKATLSKDGKIEKKCSICKKVKSTTVINKIKTVKLSGTSYKYTGKAIKPAVTVTDSKGKKISSSYYTVKYSNNIKTGTAKAVITFKGNYSGSKTLTYKIKK